MPTIPTSYERIRNYSKAFVDDLKTNQISLPNAASTPIVIKISIKDVAREIARLAKRNDCAQIAILPGLEEYKLTICILALDVYGNVLGDHIAGNLDGEETWPDDQIIKLSDYDQNNPNNRYSLFLPPPATTP